MKKIRVIIFKFFVLVGLLNSGCSDFLDTYPKNALNNSIFWETPNDAESYLNGLYGYLPGVSELNWDIISDIGCYVSPANNLAIIQKGEHDASVNNFDNWWDDCYKAIYGVNSLLENIDKIPEYEPEDKTRVIAQAKFIRAFFYARLVMLYGNVPLVTKTISVDEAKTLDQSTSDQIWDFVYQELTEIGNVLPDAYPAAETGRITKGAAIALNARSMLYAGRWDKAASLSSQVIDLDLYELYPKYEKLFSYEGENNAEVILDRQYEKDVLPHDFFSSYAPRSMNGNGNIAPTRNLVDAFQTVNGLSIADDPAYKATDPYLNRDPRLKFSVFLPACTDNSFADIIPTTGAKFDPRPGSKTADEVEVDYTRSKTGFNTKKYINIEDAQDRQNCGTNFILIRYAEVLLIYAEAKVELNQLDETVYEAINLVRNGREDVNMPAVPTGKSQDELRQLVRNERLCELSLEGLRYWDIRRWRIAGEVLQGSVPGMRYVRSGGTMLETLAYNGIVWAFRSPRDYLFPVPAQEMALNTNLVQNPDY